MLLSFLPLLLVTYASRVSAVDPEDRTAVLHPDYQWNNPTVLYDHNGKGSVPLYEAVFRQITSSTCVTFEKVISADTTGQNHLFFEWKTDNSCNSMEQKNSTCNCKRTLTIGLNCATTPKVLLNLLRALGLHYQHTRHDRDLYVDIAPTAWTSWHRILGGSSSYDLPFDPLSIMHPFTKTGVTYKDPATQLIAGKAKTLSFYDKKLLNTLFFCGMMCWNKPQCRNEGYRLQTKDCKCQCKKGFWGDRCEKHANTHHLHKMFTAAQALEIANHVMEPLTSKFNAEIATHAMNKLKEVLLGIVPSPLHIEEVASRDVYATILGELSHLKWGVDSVVKLGGKAGQKLKDVLEGHLPDIIPKAIKNGGHDIVGQAFGLTLAAHFTRSLGRGAFCVVKKFGKDVVNGIKWVGGKIKSGCETVYNALKNAPSSLYHKLASFFHLS